MFNWDTLPDAFGNRLRIALLALLMGGDRDFVELRKKTGASDGNLSVQLGNLEADGYIQKERGFADHKTRSTYRLTMQGKNAYRCFATLIVQSILTKNENIRN